MQLCINIRTHGCLSRSSARCRWDLTYTAAALCAQGIQMRSVARLLDIHISQAFGLPAAAAWVRASREEGGCGSMLRLEC